MAELHRSGITPSDIETLRLLMDVHDPPLAHDSLCLRWVGLDDDGYWVAFSCTSFDGSFAYCDYDGWVMGDHG